MSIYNMENFALITFLTTGNIKMENISLTGEHLRADSDPERRERPGSGNQELVQVDLQDEVKEIADRKSL